MYYAVTQYVKAGKRSNVWLPALFFLQSVSLAWSLMPNALTSGFVFFFFLDALLSSWM